MKVVFDTNIWISALVFPGGPPESAYRLVLDGRIQAATSTALLAELGRVLTEKFFWAPERVEEAISQLIRLCEVAKTPEVVVHIVGDPADDRVLEAAAASGSELIVSGDHHLLRLETWQGIRIVSVAEFVTSTLSPLSHDAPTIPG